MIARYLLLSGMPVNQVTMLDQINKLVKILYEDAEIVTYKPIDIGMTYLSMVELDVKYKPWTSFEFVTKLKGRYGPSKSQCLEYYKE